MCGEELAEAAAAEGGDGDLDSGGATRRAAKEAPRAPEQSIASSCCATEAATVGAFVAVRRGREYVII